jgi:hypothetical protein
VTSAFLNKKQGGILLPPLYEDAKDKKATAARLSIHVPAL